MSLYFVDHVIKLSLQIHGKNCVCTFVTVSYFWNVSINIIWWNRNNGATLDHSIQYRIALYNLTAHKYSYLVLSSLQKHILKFCSTNYPIFCPHMVTEKVHPHDQIFQWDLNNYLPSLFDQSEFKCFPQFWYWRSTFS